jgi:predicted TPR repeat methyltransferase
VLTEAKRVLAPGGVFAFTLETHRGEGVVLGEGLRYAHAAEYVRGQIIAAGLAVAHLEQASPRNEDNEPVQGLVAVVGKT